MAAKDVPFSQKQPFKIVPVNYRSSKKLQSVSMGSYMYIKLLNSKYKLTKLPKRSTNKGYL